MGKVGGALFPAAMAAFGVATGGVGFLGLTGMSAAFASFGTTLVLNMAASALAPKPKAPNFNLPNFASAGRTEMVRQAISSRKLVYGETRVSGSLVFCHVTESNKFLHMVVAIASHEIDSFVQVYMNNEPLQIGLDGNFTSTAVGGYRGEHIRVATHTGADDQAADANLVSAINDSNIWSSSHQLKGIAYAYIRLKHDINFFPTGIPNFSFLVRGKKVYDPRDGSNAFSSNPALCIRDFLTDSDFGLGAEFSEIDDTVVTSSANECDEDVTLTSTTDRSIGRLEGSLIGDMVGAGDFRLAEGLGAAFDGRKELNAPYAYKTVGSGTATGTVGKSWGRTRVVTGYEVTATESRGFVNSGASFTIKLQGSDNGTSWSDLHTSTQSQVGGVETITNRNLGISTGYKYHRLEIASPTATVRVGELQFFETGGTENRYELHGIVDTADKPNEILAQMLTSLAGRIVYSGGKFKILAGAYSSPSITLTNDDLRAPIQIHPKVSRRETANAIRGVFVNPQESYQPTDYAPVQQSTINDNNERVIRQIDLQFTQSHSAAQRIATIELKRARQQMTVNLPCKLTAFQIEVGDTIQLTNSRLGFSSKTFEVIDWTFAITEEGEGIGLGVDLVCRETESAVYDWTPTTDETLYTTSQPSALPSGLFVQAPTGLEVTETIYSTRDGAGVKTRADLSWIASADQFVNSYTIDYKLTTASTYTHAGNVKPDITNFSIFDLAPALYDFRVRPVNTLGVVGESASIQQELFGLSATPSALTNLSIEIPSIGVALLRWDRSTDLDVKIGGRIIVRHSNASSGASWAASVLLDDAVSGNATSVVLPLKAGTYLLKAVDSSGNLSALASISPSGDLSQFAFTGVATVNEHTAFAGTHTGTYAESNTLKLDGESLLDSITDFDAIDDLDLAGGVDDTGTYSFASTTDIGSVQTVRLTSTIAATIVNTLDNFDERAGNIDTWEDYDGSAASGNVEVYEKHSDDDSSYSDFARFDRTTVSGRYFQFKAVLTSSDVAYQPQVTQLTVTIDKAA